MFEELNPHRAVQRVGDWFEQRKSFRAAALVALRKREGIPSPVDAEGSPLETRFDDLGKATYHDAAGNKVDRVMFAGAGRDGKPGSFALGARKGADRELAEVSWSDGETAPIVSDFFIPEVSEDGRLLADEIRDLNRDAAGMQMAERVSHGPASEQAPGLVLANPDDEQEIDRVLQEFLKRGKR